MDTSNNNSFLISIIIPMKNEEANISRCLASIEKLKKNIFLVEVIVVDNGSTDNGVEIARKLGAKVVINETLNVAGLRNYGASIAKGTVFAFLDADCEVDTHWLVNALVYFEDLGIAAVGSTPEAPKNGNWVERSWSAFRTRREKSQQTAWINSSNFIVRRDVFHEVEGFSETLETCEDVDIGYRISMKYSMIFDPNVRVIHYGEPRTLSEFYRKELWRGKNSFAGLKKHGFVLSEAKSLSIPIYYSIILLLLLISLFIGNYFFTMLFFWILPAFVFSFLNFLKIRKFSFVVTLAVLFLIYAHARTFSLLHKYFDVSGHET